MEYATQGEVNSQRRSESIAHTLGEIRFTSKGGCHSEILCVMPEEEPIERAREDEREGLSPSTQAGEFVREEMEHIREGEHGARSPQQAIAIGLSKARRAGVKLPPPKRGKASARTRKQARRSPRKTFPGKIARDQRRSEAGKAFHCIAHGAFATSALRGAATVRSVSFRGGQKGRPDEKAPALDRIGSRIISDHGGG